MRAVTLQGRLTRLCPSGTSPSPPIHTVERATATLISHSRSASGSSRMTSTSGSARWPSPHPTPNWPYSVMSSEHYSYKSSTVHLRYFGETTTDEMRAGVLASALLPPPTDNSRCRRRKSGQQHLLPRCTED